MYDDRSDFLADVAVKSLRSSYTGLYPKSPSRPCTPGVWEHGPVRVTSGETCDPAMQVLATRERESDIYIYIYILYYIMYYIMYYIYICPPRRICIYTYIYIYIEREREREIEREREREREKKRKREGEREREREAAGRDPLLRMGAGGKGNGFKHFKDFSGKAKAKVWP